jgi:hypothetical protein
VKFQAPLFQPSHDGWVRVQIFDLLDDIPLRKR